MNGDFNAQWFARSQVLSHLSTIHFPAASRETESILVLKWTFFVNCSVGSNYKNILLLKIQLKNVEKSLKSFVFAFCSHRLIATLTMWLYEHYMHFAARKILKFPSTGQNKVIDCSQSPIFPWDRRYIARLTIYGGHLDFQVVVFTLLQGGSRNAKRSI